MQGFADAHAHPVEMAAPYEDYGEAELVLGVTSRPPQWGAMEALGDRRVVRFYGVHPWYASEWGPEAGDGLRSILARDPRAGVGEIGLDAKRGDPAAQTAAFAAQLEAARGLRRPVEIHMVGTEKEVLDALRASLPGTTVLHSFGGESYSKAFADLGCLMSLNPRILRRSGPRVSRLVSSVPEDLLLLESDAPFHPDGFRGMGEFAARLSEACGVPASRLLEGGLENARRALG